MILGMNCPGFTWIELPWVYIAMSVVGAWGARPRCPAAGEWAFGSTPSSATNTEELFRPWFTTSHTQLSFQKSGSRFTDSGEASECHFIVELFSSVDLPLSAVTSVCWVLHCFNIFEHIIPLDRFSKATMKFLQHVICLSVGLIELAAAIAPDAVAQRPLPADLNGSNFTYPWPVKLFQFSSQKAQLLEMAFMDVAPTGPANGKTAVLLHGKNFCGPTWSATAIVLAKAGYRVILPDQIGFCKSTKPVSYQFSLHQLAANTNRLLTKLGVSKATVIGHSMGGMLAARFSLMYPDVVTELILTNPIGLEDWKALGVPYIDTDTTWATEKSSTYGSIRGYEQATYYVGIWDPSYDLWVNMLVNIYNGKQADKFTWNQALIVDMVLTQPVVYEFPLIKSKTLILIGAKDNTAIGKQWSPPDVQAKLGHYDVLGPKTAAAIPGSTLVMFPDLGHAPQIQAPDRFHEALMGWLA
ncbi:hypothetical protein VTL71DRAFT_13072 [Oculimacula yallundae]|uniref:AB hydrolase-1 domain-containing protein n=1 Tax=Oculimacula yallundae TaxID=86028 RepID=A0ABR4CQJ8_9HELO